MNASINTPINTRLYTAWVARFEKLEAELNTLDAATGDGDHGVTMLKGLKAVLAAAKASDNTAENPSLSEPASVNAATHATVPDITFSSAKTFRKAAGGASGSLFGILIGALDQVAQDPRLLQKQLQESARKITDIGEAVAGDKTLLDALIPASQASTLSDAVRAAQAGYEHTQSMPARRGRARHVEGAGVGHRDAGARSVVELLSVVAELSSPVVQDDEAMLNGRGEG